MANTEFRAGDLFRDGPPRLDNLTSEQVALVTENLLLVGQLRQLVWATPMAADIRIDEATDELVVTIVGVAGEITLHQN